MNHIAAAAEEDPGSSSVHKPREPSFSHLQSRRAVFLFQFWGSGPHIWVSECPAKEATHTQLTSFGNLSSEGTAVGHPWPGDFQSGQTSQQLEQTHLHFIQNSPYLSAGKSGGSPTPSQGPCLCLLWPLDWWGAVTAVSKLRHRLLHRVHFWGRSPSRTHCLSLICSVNTFSISNNWKDCCFKMSKQITINLRGGSV